MNDVNLKPCPFCGSEDIEIYMDFHPRCKRCGATQMNVIGCEAEPKWNGRPAEEAITAKVTEQAAEIDQLRDSLRKMLNNIEFLKETEDKDNAPSFVWDDLNESVEEAVRLLSSCAK